MPQIVPVVLAVAGAIAQGGSLVAILGKIGLAIVGAVLSSAFAPKAKKPSSPSLARTGQERQQTFRSAIAPHQVIYGTTVVSGPTVYATSSGADASLMHVIVVLAAHEVDGIDDVWINDTQITNAEIDGSGNVTGGTLSGFVRIKKYLGTAAQAADADLIAEAPGGEWTSNHRLSGRAYVYVRLQQSAEKFPGGLANIKAKVRGKKLFDPRTSTTAFSNNAALCILDYLRSAAGLQIGSSEWDSAHWQAQANLADETVTITSGGATQARYTIDGSFTTDLAPADIIEDMLSSGVGDMVFRDGKFWLYLADFVDRTVTLTTKDLRGPVEVQGSRPISETFNAVRGTYTNPDDKWQPADFPPIRNPGYVLEDGGIETFQNIELPFVTEERRAQRLAKIVLETGRQEIVVRLSCKMTALRVATMDIVGLTLPQFGWTDKRFRVREWRLSEQGGIDLTLKEEASAAYDWAYGEATVGDPAPDTDFVSPFQKPPTISGLAAFSGDDELDVQSDGTIVSRVRLTWTQVPNIFVTSGGRVEVGYRLHGDTEWKAVPPALGSDTSIVLSDVADGLEYDFRVRPVNSLAVPGEWAELSAYMVDGKAAPPGNVDDFAIAITPEGVRRFTWTHTNPPADVRAGGGYLIRYYLGATSSWDAMTELHEGILTSGPLETTLLAAGTYTFAIKARDSSGNVSTTPVFISSAILPDPPLAGALLFRDELSLVWPGTKTSCFVDTDGFLHATSSQTWANLPAAWSSLPATWDSILTNNSPIRYETEIIDLGADLLMRPIVTASGSGTQTIEMKTWLSGGSEPGSWSAIAQATARYVKIRVSMAGTTPTITALQTIIDAPSVTDTIADLNVGSAATSTWFYRIAAGHFQVQPRNNIGVLATARIDALQAVGGAWTWELVSKNATANATWAASGTPPRSGYPIAEFKTRNATPALADAIVDISLRGPRS